MCDDCIQIGWMSATKCNYYCDYCDPKMNRLKHGELSADYNSYDDILNAFKKIDKKFYLMITGGEPFLNRWMFDLIYEISNLENNIGIRVDSNISITKNIKKLNNNKVMVNASFHTHMDNMDKFKERLYIYKKNGYIIGMIDYVMSKYNLKCWDYEIIKHEFKDYAPVNPQPNYNGESNYYHICAKYINKDDMYFKTGGSPKGLKCWYDCKHYNLDYKMNVSIGCDYKNKCNFIKDELPLLDDEYKICNKNRCFCLHAYVCNEKMRNKGRGGYCNSFQEYLDCGLLK